MTITVTSATEKHRSRRPDPPEEQPQSKEDEDQGGGDDARGLTEDEVENVRENHRLPGGGDLLAVRQRQVTKLVREANDGLAVRKRHRRIDQDDAAVFARLNAEASFDLHRKFFTTEGFLFDHLRQARVAGPIVTLERGGVDALQVFVELFEDFEFFVLVLRNEIGGRDHQLDRRCIPRGILFLANEVGEGAFLFLGVGQQYDGGLLALEDDVHLAVERVRPKLAGVLERGEVVVEGQVVDLGREEERRDAQRGKDRSTPLQNHAGVRGKAAAELPNAGARPSCTQPEEWR